MTAAPVVTPHADTPRQVAQATEANERAINERARGVAPIPANETAIALETAADAPQDPVEGTRSALYPQPAAEPKADPKPAPKVASPFDDKRAAITARFRTERTTTAPETGRDEITDFTRSGGMPEEFRQFDQAVGAEAQAAPDAAPEAAPAPTSESSDGAAPADAVPQTAPQTVKVKVNGQEIELPIEQVIAKAQIALASENILDEVKRLKNELIDRAQPPARPGQDGHHAAPQNGHHADLTTQPAEPGQAADPALQHQESPIKKLIESIQFGDPNEAEPLLLNTIGQMTEAATRKAFLDARILDDAAAADRALNEFSKQHTDIANDPKARAVIEADIFEQQAKDLQALNVDFGKIRHDGRQATPADIANYHQILRSQGYNVRSPAQLLERAHGNFLEWTKGIKPQPPADPPPPAPAPQQQQRSAAPRVEITVDRSQRRQAAVQQPSRPAPQPAPQPPAPQSRSDVVKAMKERNATRRGQTLGIGT